MKRPRAVGASLILSLLLVLLPLAAPPTAVAADRPAFSGSIRDAVGNVLEGAEVLVVAGSATPQPLASTLSDGTGKFAFAELAPGTYRVAALKDGYLTSVQAINTTLHDWIDIVLRAVPAFDADEADSVPRDPSWALRLPRRQILREIDPVPGENRPFESFAPPEADTGLGMQVEQMFALGSGVERQSTEEPSLNGSMTQVRLETAVGRRGSIRLHGSHQSVDSTRSVESSDLNASREANSLQAAISYETDSQDRLSAGAFFRSRNLEWSTQAPEEAVSRRQRQQRYWGYASHWTRQIDPRSSVTVALDYQDVRLGRPGVEPDELLVDGGGPALSGRVANISGNYRMQVAPAHRVEIALGADLFDAPSFGATGAPAERGARGPWGLSMELDARDTWKLAGPVSVVYGLSYRQAMDEESSSTVVPRVGATWLFERFAWRFMLSHHARDGAGPGSRLGYDAQVEVPISGRIRVIGSTAFTPARFEVIGLPSLSTVDIADPIYLTDGRADVWEDRVAVINDLGRTHSFVEWNSGRAEGNLAPVPIQDRPLRERSAGTIEYEGGRAGVHIVPSGTVVVLQYTRVTHRPSDHDYGDSGSRQQILELRLTQDLAQSRNLGNWRFLMAARLESLSNGDDDEVSDNALESLSRQLSAGLSVEF